MFNIKYNYKSLIYFIPTLVIVFHLNHNLIFKTYNRTIKETTDIDIT